MEEEIFVCLANCVETTLFVEVANMFVCAIF